MRAYVKTNSCRCGSEFIALCVRDHYGVV